MTPRDDAAGLSGRARLALRLLRGEGPGSVVRRLLDRLEERRRRRSFTEVGEDGLVARAAVLNVLGTLPAARLGGVPLSLVRRLEEEAARRTVALLYPFRAGHRLEVEERGRRVAVGFASPAPAPEPVVRDEAFEAAVARGARQLGAATVHIENLAGLAPQSVAVLPRAGLRLVLGVHDFAPFCPRPHLLEEPAQAFCHYCTEPERCGRCLAWSWRLPTGFLAEYRRHAAEALRAAEAVVYPSAFLRDRHAALVPGLDPERQHVIAPSSGAAAPEPRTPPAPGRLHVAFVGAMKAHKGALVFEEVVRAAEGGAGSGPLRFSAYGGGDTEILRRLRGRGVSVHGYYRAGSLPTLLRRDGVDVALFPSVWPETYSLVVDECLLAGVPVVAFDMGAPAERLRGGQGILVPPGAGAEALLRAVAEAGRRGAAPSTTIPTPARGADEMLALYARLGVSS